MTGGRGARRWAVFALALTGCGLSIDTPDVGPSNMCAVDSDCAGARCDLELGICVRDTVEAYGYTLQFVLPAVVADGRPALVAPSGPFIAQSGDALAEVVIRDAVDVAGRVRTLHEGTPVEADVIFTPRTSVPGPALPTITASALGATSATGDDPRLRDSDYATQLLPGIRYDVEIRPRGEDAARFARRRASFELEAGQRFDVELLAPEEHYILRGFVVDADGAGQNDLEIRAIDSGGRVVSSVATTAADGEGADGAFVLHVDPTVREWVLRVSAPPAYQESSAFPTITVDPAVLANEGTLTEPRVRILVPSSDDNSVCFAGTVELPEELGGGPAVGATVTFRSREISDSVTRLVSSYTIQVASVAGAPDDGPDLRPVGCSGAPLPAGGFETRVVPGLYDVEITPIEPELGVYVSDPEEPRPIREETYGPVFVVPARPRLGGVVQRSEEEPVIDARVRAVPLHTPLPMATRETGAWRINRPGETITDPRGNFRLPLDVGVYDLIAEPPSGSGFPWVVRPAFAMAAREWTEVLDVRHPVAIRGRAHFDDGADVAGAEIAVYAIAGEVGAERAVPIGRATTAADGSFLLLLPPEI